MRFPAGTQYIPGELGLKTDGLQWFGLMQETVWQILAWIMIAPSFLRADTVVAIWTGQQVTIAADSKRMITRNGKAGGGTENVCKLRPAGDLVIATAGLVGSEEEDFVAATENKNGEAVSAAKSGLERIMTLRERFSGTHMYDTGRNVSVVLAGVVDGKPTLSRIHILPVPPALRVPGSSTDFATSVVSYPGSDPNRAIEVIGIANAIFRSKLRAPREWESGPDAEVATRLVTVEANDKISSPFVGGPISSMAIDGKGVHWIQKGLCDWGPRNQ